MAQGNVDVLKLQTKGKAKLSERAGTIALKADDPVCALQAIARQANINIFLTPEEMERIGGAGKLQISLSYANNLAGASEAAKNVFSLAGDAHAALGQKNQVGLGKILGFAGLAVIIAGLAFVLAYKMLEKIYG
ncbi:hypothetical protein SKTS_34560 [Sulfurimicrobium lacus]|uniref:Uncharacterized protein n=1 Tax=Sulfurimicrobium lacus TaxID=2715678 RepID=A0A6F8VGU5_9PROT|nr:hypothetical protein [Sulfurimicrobium lacus]BCB28570.1 hypothetical protein SKTS_34560 [Sulfurimicrobium lacus]